MSDIPQIVLQPRSQSVADLIDAHIAGDLTYDQLMCRIEALGYRTTSVYEMVIAREAELRS